MISIEVLIYWFSFSWSFKKIVLYFRMHEENENSAFDHESSSLIKLNNGTVLYLREVSKFLALVCILREDNFDKQGKL